jgi:hypothetical protein
MSSINRWVILRHAFFTTFFLVAVAGIPFLIIILLDGANSFLFFTPLALVWMLAFGTSFVPSMKAHEVFDGLADLVVSINQKGKHEDENNA